jgi:hypothetical protein
MGDGGGGGQQQRRRQQQLNENLDGVLTRSRELRRQCIKLQIKGDFGSRYVRRNPLLPGASSTVRECARGVRQLEGAQERLFKVYQAAAAVTSAAATGPRAQRREQRRQAAGAPYHLGAATTVGRREQAAPCRPRRTADNVEVWAAALLSPSPSAESSDRAESGARPGGGVRRRLIHSAPSSSSAAAAAAPAPAPAAPVTVVCDRAATVARRDSAVSGPKRNKSSSPVFSVVDSPEAAAHEDNEEGHGAALAGQVGSATPKPKALRGEQAQAQAQSQAEARPPASMKTTKADTAYRDTSAGKHRMAAAAAAAAACAAYAPPRRPVVCIDDRL